LIFLCASSDVEPGGRRERDVPDAALGQVDAHVIAADLGGVDPLAGDLGITRPARARKLRQHLSILRPRPGGPAAEAHGLDLVRIEGEHEWIRSLALDVGVEEIGRVPVQQRAHQIGIEGLRESSSLRYFKPSRTRLRTSPGAGSARKVRWERSSARVVSANRKSTSVTGASSAVFFS
jgi:hypothetical protein